MNDVLEGDRLPDGLGYAGMKGRAFFRSGFQGRLHEVRIGWRNPRERCDAAFLKNREPGDWTGLSHHNILIR